MIVSLNILSRFSLKLCICFVEPYSQIINVTDKSLVTINTGPTVLMSKRVTKFLFFWGGGGGGEGGGEGGLPDIGNPLQSVNM